MISYSSMEWLWILLMVVIVILLRWVSEPFKFEGSVPDDIKINPVDEARWRETGIPKIIHQTAPADETKWHKLWKPCQQSWKEKFPDWQYMFWNDEDLENLIKTDYPWFYDTYKGYDKQIKRVDAARYFMLHKYGGMYVDMDYECVNNFEHLLPGHKVSIAESPYKNDGRPDTETHQNALMASPQGHPFWERIFKILDDHKNHDSVVYATGPYVIIKGVKELGEYVHTLEYELFAPSHTKQFKRAQFEKYNELPPVDNKNIYARHLGTGAWV